jgi:hypothetical protein
LNESSKNALRTTERIIIKDISALEQTIRSRCQILTWAFSKKCLQAAALISCIIRAAALTDCGMIALTRSEVTDLRQEIAELKEQKSLLGEGQYQAGRGISGARHPSARGEELSAFTGRQNNGQQNEWHVRQTRSMGNVDTSQYS